MKRETESMLVSVSIFILGISTSIFCAVATVLMVLGKPF